LVKPASATARSSQEDSPDGGPTDEQLMMRFCEGEPQAFDVLFARHGPPVHRFLARASGNPEAADDLTQAAFLSLVKARERFRAGARFKPWLYAIALNAARDWRRRHREVLTREGTLPTTLAAEPASQSDAGLEKAVRAALNELPANQREAILLHRYEGLSFAEVAEALGASETAVKVRAHRGYERLRVKLRGLWEDA
jgi:RNA polymerase sigma factor (sigma-70 family)